ncbi:MAG TPA: hypothetical protein VIX19_07020 [Terriglobales bacterium]
MGASGGAAVSFDLTHRVRVLANGLDGSGDGRYLIGLGPATVVRRDDTPSLVHSGTGLAGFAAQKPMPS